MINFLRKISQFLRVGWIKIGFILLGITMFSQITMPFFEGWSQFDTFWWTVISTTTVGYGDMSPGTVGGKICGMIVIWLGIGTMAIAISNFAECIMNLREDKIKGRKQYMHQDHIVILGWLDHRTPGLIQQLRAEKDEPIVVCSNSIDENPMPGIVDFVKGDICSDDIAIRSNICKAKKVIIYTKNDNDALTAAIAAKTHNTQSRIITYIRDKEKKIHLDRINTDSRIKVILQCSVNLIAQEVQDGCSSLVGELIDNNAPGTIYKVVIPQDQQITTYDFEKAIREKFDRAIVIGFKLNGKTYNCPSNEERQILVKSNHPFKNGFYIINIERINWNDIFTN